MTTRGATERAFDRELDQLERQVDRIRDARASTGQRAAPDETPPLDGLSDLGEGLGAEVGGAIGVPGGPVRIGGGLTTGPAWSTIKVPIALQVLEDAGGPAGLKPGQRGLIERALTASDNEAAAALYQDLADAYGGAEGAAGALTELLRATGDPITEVSTIGRNGFSAYGQTEWSLDAQQRFLSALLLGCIGSPASNEYVRALMGRVTSDAWGLGSARVPAIWKGGWGPDPDGRYLLRQMGAIDLDGQELVVSLAVRPNDGDFAHGQAIATEVARWLVGQARRARPPPGGGC